MRFLTSLALTFSLLVSVAACSAKAIGPGASGTSPPPVRVGQAITEWEHYCVYPQADFATVLAEAGRTGFEMVGMTVVGDSILLCFKRPVVSAGPTVGAPGQL